MVSASRLSSAGQPRGKPAVKAATGPHNPTARRLVVRLVTPAGDEHELDLPPLRTFGDAQRYAIAVRGAALVGWLGTIGTARWLRDARRVIRANPGTEVVVCEPGPGGRLGGYRTAAE